MKFITFQRMGVADILKEGSEWTMPAPLFSVPIASKEEIALYNILMTPPNPECCIVFETEEYFALDYFTGAKLLPTTLHESICPLYVCSADSLKPEQVLQIIKISDDSSRARTARLDYIYGKEFDELISNLLGDSSKHFINIFKDLCLGDMRKLKSNLNALRLCHDLRPEVLENIMSIKLVTE